MSTASGIPGTPQVPGYELLRPLGRGAMGEVFLARQLRLGRLVAIKFLTADGTSDPEKRAARFRREAELMARISHPNILGIHDFGEVDGHPFLVMEYVERGDLRRMMRPGRPMPAAQAMAILDAVAEALDHLHRLGILHRDLKPENILMHDEANPKVADFGLAVLRTGAGSLTQTQEGLGTLGYVAPEQRYRLRIDERADQYSLAALSYELLTGSCPLGIIRPPSQLNPRLRRVVDSVLLRALKEDPDDRYPSIRRFVDDLQASLSVSIPTRSSTRLGRSTWTWPLVGMMAASVAVAAVVLPRIKRPTETEASGTVAGWVSVPTPVEKGSGASSRMGGPIRPASAPSSGPTRTNPMGMTMVRLPAGEFWMGSPPDDPMAKEDEHPRRLVRISQPFWMAAHEVTHGQFRSFVEDTGYITIAESEGGRVWDRELGQVRADTAFHWRDPGYGRPPLDDEPVVQIARPDAEEFCRWLSERDGRAYRLPTEAEWEYACRAGSTTRWSMGDDPDRLAAFAWWRANSSWRLRPVGSKQPNRWGLFDLHGNAWELCSDWYAPYPPPDPTGAPIVDPKGPTSGYRWVIRGGSWDGQDSESQTRSAARSHKVSPYFTVGFRVCHDDSGAGRTAGDESESAPRPAEPGP
ncbi:bifunctional serine/threonine-protein kinase/formylglycine-generating enzyme family protein [Tautonia sociabilis]|uniref:Protein kinase domain-containing protein n=1 Tax=Tautonia sociabilis TaxID=2080755 RepID=A0A432MJS6_9BACT|nr:bifunctional serine/threonine-protein kinase/formylglycine-generating enzyme family protein [Tautonia sociabilis]RUL87378.1 hypothetical protein TsocGM_12675 [Tautonia sociabilis]